jgi:hypothetical protein
MNNILDYSHMIKTYIMVTEFEPINKCTCENNIQCFQINELNNCEYKELIFDNLPLFNILVNPNTKIKFILPKKIKKSNMDLVDFVKVLLYIIKFKDESIDFVLNRKHIKTITILSLYVLIIKNYNIMTHIMFIFRPFVSNIKKILNDDYLNNNDNINILRAFFKKYFTYTPDECINIMKSWDTILDKLIKEE